MGLTVDAEGKALIVTQDASVSQIERSAAAAEAGAALLVVINDGAGTLYDIAAGTVPVICLAMFVLYAAAGYFIIRRTEKRWEEKGRRYVETESDRQMVKPDRENLPGLAAALAPMVRHPIAM